MSLGWHSIEGEVLLNGDYSRILLQEEQRQLLLVSQRNLWVHDLDTFEVNHMLPLEGVVSSSATLDPARRHLFVGTEYGEKMLVVDLHALTVTPVKLKAGCRDIALMAVRRQLYWLGHDAMSIVSLKEKRPRVVRQTALKGDQRGVCLALSPDEQTLAVGRDGKGELYRAENFSFKSNFELPSGVQRLAFSPDGRFLVSAGGLIHGPTLEEGESLLDRIHEAYYTDARLMVWDAGSGELRAQSPEHEQTVRCVAWHPQRPLLAAAGGLSTIQLWEMPEQGMELIASDTLHLPPYYGSLRDLTFTQDGVHLLALSDRGLIEFRLEGTPSIRQLRATVHQPLHATATPLFSPEEGRWHEGQLWFNNGRQWAVYDPQSRSLVRESPVDEHAYALHMSPQHQKLLRYRSNNSQSHRIEVRTLDGQLLTSIRDVPKGRQDFSPGYGFVMRLEDDGTTVTFGQPAQVFRVSLLNVNVRYTRVFEQGDVQLTSLNTPAGLAVTVGGVRDTLRLWNTLTHASMIALEPWQLDGLSGYVTKAHLDSDSRLALGTSKGEVRVYDLTSGLYLMRGTRHGEGVVNDLTFSPEGSLLASAAQDGTVRLWDVRTGEEMAAFTHPAAVSLVRFSPLANELVSIDQHGTIFTWDLNSLGAWREATGMPAAPEGVPASTPTTALLLDEREQYLADARQGKLGRYGERSWALHLRTPPEHAPGQGGRDLMDAYRAARTHAARFAEQLEQFGEAHGARVRIRPGSGIKDANRSVEKLLTKSGGLPTDLLGGTVIVDSVARMYGLAERLGEAFEVVGFRDRMIYRARSQYGDLQFSVMLERHLAEVKIVHDLFQQIDRYEHRVYEIQRSLDAEFTEEDLPLAERFVGDALAVASRQMYTAAWEWITAREEGLDD